jgi:hypothetical protein
MAGVGLLLLRLCVLALLVEVLRNIQPIEPRSMRLVIAGTAVAISMGFLTPIAAAFALCELSVYVPRGVSLVFVFITGALCLALALLGPGYYSIDSLIFGRKRIVFPK